MKWLEKRLFGAVFAGLGVAGCGGAEASTAADQGPDLNRHGISACQPAAAEDFAFTSQADGDSEIYLYEAKSGSIRKITDNAEQDLLPSCSPDGRQEIYGYDLARSAAGRPKESR